MKKNVLLFTIMLLGLAFSSCLKEEDEKFYGENDFAYITTNPEGVQIARIYNRNIGGFFAITSDEIQNNLQLGECYILSYRWETKMGFIEGGDITVYDAELTNISGKLDKSSLTVCEEIPAIHEDSVFFKMRPVADYDAANAFFDDNWIIEYSFRGKNKASAKLDFYMIQPQPVEDEYIIDVVMTKTEEGEGETEFNITDNVVVNLRYIRDLYPATGSNSNLKTLNIKFRYYDSGLNQLYTTPAFDMVVYSN